MTAANPAHPGPDPAPPRVLVVEDNEVNQPLVLAMLGRSGFVVEVAMDGLQATREVRRPA